MIKKFLRRDAARFSKFGKGRGKKAKWRAPKGRDNKMREKRKGYASVVSVGYKKPVSEIETIQIMNVKDLEKIGKNSEGIVGAVGKKKKAEIAEKAKELKVKLRNLNPEKYLKENSKSEKNKTEENKK